MNGDCQGVAAANLPPMLYAVVDMYGKCAQVTVTAPATPDSSKMNNYYDHSLYHVYLYSFLPCVNCGYIYFNRDSEIY